MEEYIPLLCKNIFSTYNIQGDRIQLKLDIMPINLDVSTVIPIGLVLNELITNTLKYAFPDDRKGILEVGLKRIGEHLTLCVRDNGIGYDPEKNEANTFGSRLIRSFSTKLNADLNVTSDAGTEVELVIKKYQVA